MVTGSAIHTLWTTKGLALKYCSDQAGPCSDLVTATNSYWNLVYDLGAILGFRGPSCSSCSCSPAVPGIRRGRPS
jgi:hypothetical protein